MQNQASLTTIKVLIPENIGAVHTFD